VVMVLVRATTSGARVPEGDRLELVRFRI
jgi:hypothetical protein